MILKFYINEKGEKVYTLKGSNNGKQTEEAHYKFIKLRDNQNKDS